MHLIVLAIVIVVAAYITINHGVGRAVAVVYLPSILMLSKIMELNKPHVLDLNAVNAAIYGILIGLPMSRDRLAFRVNILDGIVVLLTGIVIVSAMSHGEFYTGVSYFLRDFLTRLCPYFFCRVALSNLDNRRRALRAMMMCSFIIFACAVIEVRLRPQWIHHLFYYLHIGPPPFVMSLYRFGFFRVNGFVEHPIYFGNICLVMTGFLIVLAMTTGRRLTEKTVAAAVACALGSTFLSLSFTPIIGVFATAMIYVTLRYLPGARFFLIPGTVAFILGLLLFTQYLANQPVSRSEGASDFDKSYENRQLIIRGAWKLATTAPLWGWGRDFEWTEYSLDSIDNSYLVFAIQYGPFYLWVWVSIALVIAMRASRVLGHAQTTPGRTGIAVGTATLLGLMVAMFTVWAGAIYTILWICLLGFMNSIYDWTIYGAPQVSPLCSVRR